MIQSQSVLNRKIEFKSSNNEQQYKQQITIYINKFDNKNINQEMKMKVKRKILQERGKDDKSDII